MRTFIAIEMTPSAVRQLTATQRRLAQQLRGQQLERCVRWTHSDNLHLTLRFLGEIDSAQRDALLEALPIMAVQHSLLSLRIEGLGCFPNAQRPNVIWCGLQGDVRLLTQLQVEVEKTVRSLDIPPDKQKFKPHLTIGRLQRSVTNSQLRAVGEIVTQVAAAQKSTPAGETMWVSELLLVQSELTSSGPVYTRLGAFPLGSL